MTGHVETKETPYTKAVKSCASLNATLAVFKNSEDLNKIACQFRDTMPAYIDSACVVTGVSYGGMSVPNVYRRSLVAHDKTVIHHSLSAHVDFKGEQLDFFFCFRPHASKGYFLNVSSFQYLGSLDAFCELTSYGSKQNHSQIIQMFNAKFSFRTGTISFSKCPNGQMVHTFLACHPHNVCGQSILHLSTCSFSMESGMVSPQGTSHLMTSVSVFTCSDDVTRLSYTFVCDFRHHCKDGSDETFCQHPPCGSFACDNGQCVSYFKRCDMISDCLDGSDELMCGMYLLIKMMLWNTTSPVLIDFDGAFSFKVMKMSVDETCPETHYRCPGDYNDCLPVYTLCNGWYDCMDQEDEGHCEHPTCPGFYRCFNSTVCVHGDHLCDGWPHCPQHDDELLCDVTCPAQCFCQGLAFLCFKAFNASLFPHLRSLDARGSGMTLSALSNNSYIVHLSLSNCHLISLPIMTFPNLQFLDLSANSLSIISMASFTSLHNLRTLALASNSIGLIRHAPMSTVQLIELMTVDLSHNKLTVFDSTALSNMANVQSLNLSSSVIHTILPSGFKNTPKLTHLYLEGNPINTFSSDLLKTLTALRVLSSQSYKLCCAKMLPDHFELITCYAPQNEISSCEDLLQSGMYRGFLWLISSLSLLGNMFCIVVRVCVCRTASTSGFNFFVTNLSVADLIMGVYMGVIGVADSLFRERYLFYDVTWKHSVACKVAGFLSLLSCEVSALTIWLITLDRFIALHFPFSSVRFQRKSAAAACVMAWVVGLSLSLVPLLPVTSHWQFYSQTGICIPLPVTRQDFKGKMFSISIFMVLNFVLFMLVASGQVFIYWSVQKNILKTDSSKVSKDLTVARRLISVAVTDFLCWFPIGLCGLLALADIPIPGEVNVALAIFVLPLNSALNPFMYTFNMLMEKRRKSREALLLMWLEKRTALC